MRSPSPVRPHHLHARASVLAPRTWRAATAQGYARRRVRSLATTRFLRLLFEPETELEVPRPTPFERPVLMQVSHAEWRRAQPRVAVTLLRRRRHRLIPRAQRQSLNRNRGAPDRRRKVARRVTARRRRR